MNEPIFLDTETCGLCGPITLLQYAIGGGEIVLHEPWNRPIQETIDLFEMIATHPGGVVLFNAVFDWFQIAKMGTTLLLMEDKSKILIDCVEEYALKESEGRNGPCVKPVAALDLMLHARKGPYQNTMNRGDIRIRRVPTALSYLLANELDHKIELPSILFARQRVKKKWSTYAIEHSDGTVDPNFRDVVLKFAPSSGLKALAVEALGVPEDEILAFGDIEPEGKPVEIPYAPYATAVGQPGAWQGAWPDLIHAHVDHWATHEAARKYATLDIVYTRGLYHHFGKPEMGDDDSELACMVGAVRWRGFRIIPEGIKKLKEQAEAKVASIPTSPNKVKDALWPLLSEEEKLATGGSTKKTILEALAKQTHVRCEPCNGQGCELCNGEGFKAHPAAEMAGLILDARKAKYEINFFEKLLLAGRLHASFDVIGALSSRMSGSGGGLNTQGIKRDKYVREQFPLAWDGYVLCGGDFAGFEVVLAEAAYNDPDLRRDLQIKRACLKCTTGESCEKCGKTGAIGDRLCECKTLKPKPGCDDCFETGLADTKIHALFGQNVYPDMTYEQILKDKDKYTRCKSAVFAMLYGGEGYTLQDRLGVEIEIANAAHARFCAQYPGVGRAQKRTSDMFCTMRQDENTCRINWDQPADYIESLFGFRRYFTLENRITKHLFDLAQAPPRTWRNLNIRVERRSGREQTASGATQSALFGAAFAVQASNKRAAGNHEIQSSGATITKALQRKIWDFQPAGVNPWMVIPLNVHDEIMCPTSPDLVEDVRSKVDNTVEAFRSKVPLIKMVWSTHLKTWADK
jgi:hypothetical protein